MRFHTRKPSKAKGLRGERSAGRSPVTAPVSTEATKLKSSSSPDSAPVLKTLESGAVQVVERLQAARFEAYWVGGCVRDFLLGRAPGDYDVATSAVPDQIEKVFERTIPVGKKFGVLVVVLDKHQCQVATFRAESDYQDGRRPGKVSFGDPKADAL